jgi:hypothetical protein
MHKKKKDAAHFEKWNAHSCGLFEFQNAPQVFKLCNGLCTRNVQGGLYYEKYYNKLGYPSPPPPPQKENKKEKRTIMEQNKLKSEQILD